MTVRGGVLSTHTHFFRGEEELSAAVVVLAERAASGRKPRLLSAGCSTGAEPYTIAVLCAERAIDVAIHATDLNPAALAVARAARYPSLALRHVPEPVLARHFERCGDEYAVVQHIARRVTFEQGDLRTDPIPSRPIDEGEDGWDVIVCRNVLIYYDEEVASAIVARLAATLGRDGVLIVGGTDPFAFRPGPSLHLMSASGVASYARGARRDPTLGEAAIHRAELLDHSLHEPALDGLTVALRPSVKGESDPLRSQRSSDSRFSAGAAGAAAAPREDDLAAMLAAACGALAAHDWDEAEAALLRAEQIAPVAPEPPLYLGVLRRKEGRFDEAFIHLRRAVFLSPDCWTASYLLAGAWERLGDPVRARMELEHVVKTLERLGAEVPCPAGAELAGVAFDPVEVARMCKERLDR